MNGLQRINLIAGRNSAGKTTLLEALLMICFGHAGATVTPVVLRGMAQPETSPSAVLDVVWKQMFATFVESRPIEIEANHAVLGCLRLRLVTEASDTKLSANLTDEAISVGRGAPMLKATMFHGDEERENSVQATDHEVRMGRGDEPVVIPVGFMASGGTGGSGILAKDAAVLGNLKKQKRDRLVVEALQTIAPRLTRLEIITATGAPMIWGDIGLEELVPLPAMGEGMVRFARMALLMLDGCKMVLLDEVENGIHHSILPQLWTFIERTALRFDLQVFATTHSFECVQAAYRTLEADQFRLHRLEVDEDGSNRTVTYEPDAIDAAIRHHLEVR